MVFYMHLLKCHSFNLGPNKKIGVFQIMGLNILGRVGTNIFFSG